MPLVSQRLPAGRGRAFGVAASNCPLRRAARTIVCAGSSEGVSFWERAVSFGLALQDRLKRSAEPLVQPPKPSTAEATAAASTAAAAPSADTSSSSRAASADDSGASSTSSQLRAAATAGSSSSSNGGNGSSNGSNDSSNGVNGSSSPGDRSSTSSTSAPSGSGSAASDSHAAAAAAAGGGSAASSSSSNGSGSSAQGTGAAVRVKARDRGAEGADRVEGAAAGGGEQLRLEVRVVEGMAKVPQEEWDAVAASSAGGEVNPFLLWAFLHAVEESGSAAPSAGWLPQHLLARDAASGRLVGAVPLYLKSHSYGEYVFDSSWANAAEMMGVRYYPKLQAAVPFTPVTGPRLMVAGGLDEQQRAAVVRALGKTLLALADSLGVSGVHVTFNSAAEWAALQDLGFKQRLGIQFHWDNPGYATFDDYLADLKQSKRKSVRQERKSVERAGLQLHRLPGSQLRPEHWDRFYEFYTGTVDRKWGNAYLTRDFFHRLGDALPDRVLLATASEGGSTAPGDVPLARDVVAGALNLVGSHALFGRNWGCADGREIKNLHFELCYYQALDEAIARRLPRVEAGAQGEHKLQRGYLPSFTYSSHFLRDPALAGAVDRFLSRERGQIEYTLQVLSLQASPYKKDRTIDALLSKVRAHRSLSSGDSVDAGEE